MRFTDFLTFLDGTVTPESAKLHLATPDGESKPLDAYLAGEFEEWQAWQSKLNFERPHVVSLIRLPGVDRWLFAGVFEPVGSTWGLARNKYKYELLEKPSCGEFKGRLVIRYARTGRGAYRNLENLIDQMVVEEILPRPMAVGEFPGFKAIDVSKRVLDVVVREAVESWRVALSNVAGVYLISDPGSGRLYVGSAAGAGGIWARWCAYSAGGHGGNKLLKELVEGGDEARVQSLRFAVLEIADLHSTEPDILQRESHWKRILLSREFGLNAN